MISKMALGIVLGITTRALQEFYIRLKEVDEFGRMSYEDAAELMMEGKGTVAQHERLTALALANLHAASDAQQLRGRSFDVANPEDLEKLRKMFGNESQTEQFPGQFL